MEKEGGVHEDPKGIFFLKVCSVYFYSILKHYDRCWTDSCVQTVEKTDDVARWNCKREQEQLDLARLSPCNSSEKSS